MTRPERRRWEREIWPHWKNFILFKKIIKIGPGLSEKTDPRTKEEIVYVIDCMLRDLGEVPA